MSRAPYGEACRPRRLPRQICGRRTSRKAFSLLEVTISFGILLVALLGFTRLSLSSNLASSNDHEVTSAKEAARRMVEVLQGTEFADVFALYNGEPADDPAGAGTAPGSGFDVPGVQAVEGDADGLAGEIIFPVRVGSPGTLREDVTRPSIGMPRDLNGDEAVDALDHSGDYKLLPVIVRVDWRGASGPAALEFQTLLADY